MANRVCVALSRAKWALYVLGNFEHLAENNEELWGGIVKGLKEKSLLGNGLPVSCLMHE